MSVVSLCGGASFGWSEFVLISLTCTVILNTCLGNPLDRAQRICWQICRDFVAHFRHFSLLVPLYGHLDVGILSYQIALHISICLFKPYWLYKTFFTFEIRTWLNFGKAASYFFMKISP